VDPKEFMKSDACDECARVVDSNELNYCANCHRRVCDNCLMHGEDGRNLCGECHIEGLIKSTEDGGYLYEGP
jgi:hypothetical protein